MDESGQQNVFKGDIVPVESSALERDPRHQLLMQTLNEAQVDFLLQRTPKHEIKTRQGRGGLQFSYVEHGYVTERLNLVFGFNWDFEVTDKQILDDEVIVEARLTVRTPGGQTIVKTQFGGAEIKRHASGPRSGRPLSIADDYKAAASDALKKCASLLGIGLDLYGRDRPYDTEDAPAAPPQARSEPRRERVVEHEPVKLPTAQEGLCTPEQWREISRLAGRSGMEVAELCESLGVGTLAQLTEARAERVIRRLRELAAHSRADAS
ncbi:MAG TPA: Rad52/Rad22 family DNA repair protein [Chloroflexia bacterium]|nr:Rad52/Rad22 family DNA repair protein [Chloroflexia bacterium]